MEINNLSEFLHPAAALSACISLLAGCVSSKIEDLSIGEPEIVSIELPQEIQGTDPADFYVQYVARMDDARELGSPIGPGNTPNVNCPGNQVAAFVCKSNNSLLSTNDLLVSLRAKLQGQQSKPVQAALYQATGADCESIGSEIIVSHAIRGDQSTNKLNWYRDQSKKVSVDWETIGDGIAAVGGIVGSVTNVGAIAVGQTAKSFLETENDKINAKLAPAFGNFSNSSERTLPNPLVRKSAAGLIAEKAVYPVCVTVKEDPKIAEISLIPVIDPSILTPGQQPPPNFGALNLRDARQLEILKQGDGGKEKLGDVFNAQLPGAPAAPTQPADYPQLLAYCADVRRALLDHGFTNRDTALATYAAVMGVNYWNQRFQLSKQAIQTLSIQERRRYQNEDQLSNQCFIPTEINHLSNAGARLTLLNDRSIPEIDSGRFLNEAAVKLMAIIKGTDETNVSGRLKEALSIDQRDLQINFTANAFSSLRGHGGGKDFDQLAEVFVRHARIVRAGCMPPNEPLNSRRFLVEMPPEVVGPDVVSFAVLRITTYSPFDAIDKIEILGEDEAREIAKRATALEINSSCKGGGDNREADQSFLLKGLEKLNLDDEADALRNQLRL